MPKRKALVPRERTPGLTFSNGVTSLHGPRSLLCGAGLAVVSTSQGCCDNHLKYCLIKITQSNAWHRARGQHLLTLTLP